MYNHGDIVYRKSDNLEMEIWATFDTWAFCRIIGYQFASEHCSYKDLYKKNDDNKIIIMNPRLKGIQNEI